MPTTAYRLQCIHHAAVLQLDTVIFVVAKGGSASSSSIIYSVTLKFMSAFIGKYLFCLDTIQVTAFEWLRMPAQHIPKEYDKCSITTGARPEVISRTAVGGAHVGGCARV